MSGREPHESADPIPDRPLNLRPSRRPHLVQTLHGVLLGGCLLVLLGAPVWFFMHGAAAGWQEDHDVTASVAQDTRCRVGPPPGPPTTCLGTWSEGGKGDISNRYGGPAPGPGERVEGREVADDLVLTGFNPLLLGWALAAPYLAIVGALCAGLGALGLRIFDPRWWTRRTDLPN